jgi:hypothetical protein
MQGEALHGSSESQDPKKVKLKVSSLTVCWQVSLNSWNVCDKLHEGVFLAALLGKWPNFNNNFVPWRTLNPSRNKACIPR